MRLIINIIHRNIILFYNEKSKFKKKFKYLKIKIKSKKKNFVKLK